MQKLALLFVCIVLSIVSMAQVTYSYFAVYEGKNYKVTEQSIVKNSEGKTLLYTEWTGLMKTGNYKMGTYNVVNGIPAEFMVRLLSDPERMQINDQMSMQQKMAAGISEGKEFPLFSVADINGTKISLGELKGKIVVLNFWFIQCAPCVMELPHLNKIAEYYSNNKDVVFIAISRADDANAIASFLKTKPFGYRQVAEEFGKPISMSNGIMGFPTNVIIDRQGMVHKLYTGYKAELPGMLRADIEALLIK